MINLYELNLNLAYHFINMFVKVNTFQAIKDYFKEGLEASFDPNEIQTLFEITAEHFLGWTRTEQRMKYEARLSESELLDFHFTLKRLKLREPIQYILEEAPFFGLLFKVTPDVLIPRPETEELVQLILNDNSGDLTVLDLGTGSGCIPIALKSKRTNWDVYGIDLSESALTIAKYNSEHLQAVCQFAQHDILIESDLPTDFPKKFDIIVSNPPYIRNSERNKMDAGVTDFEPHLALFVDDNDSLIFYKRIADMAMKWLNEKGKLYLEVNQELGSETAELLIKKGFTNVQILKDINANERMIYACK